jgi:hypothetical protein
MWRTRSILCAIAGMAVLCGSLVAEPAPTPLRPVEESAKVGKAIEDVLLSPDYVWRLPREKAAGEGLATVEMDLSFLDRFQDVIKRGYRAFGRFLRRIDRWLDKVFGEKKREARQAEAFDIPPRPLFFLAAALAASVLGIMLYRAWRRRGLAANAQGVVAAVEVQPDPLAESTTADQLPVDRWMAMAQDLMVQGRVRAAMRAMFLASLAHLAGQGGISLAKHKSNREYQRELGRRAHDCQAAVALFDENMRMIECVWYGNVTPAEESVTAYAANVARLLAARLHPGAARAPGAGGRT